jgi:hypothetical protein
MADLSEQVAELSRKPPPVEPTAEERQRAAIAARDANYTGIVISVYDPVGCWNGTSEHPCVPCAGLIKDVKILATGKNDWTIGLTSAEHFWIRKSPESQHGQPMLMIYKNGEVTDTIKGYTGLIKDVIRMHPNLKGNET